MILSKDVKQKQEKYRDARFNNEYDDIWQTVGKCTFCDLNEKYIFFEENGIVMTVNLFAYIDGHFMIVPRRHIRSTKELSQTEWETIRKFTYIAKKIIKDVHGIKGVQFLQKEGATAQSTVNEHIHFHCIPFDAPDLCEWNFRKLKYTPLQNALLYKNARKKIISYDKKYATKYHNTSKMGVVCDLIVLNTNKQVLFQHRKLEYQLSPNYLTLPGGHIDGTEKSFEQELLREVKEEVGVLFDESKLKLVDSRVGNISYAKVVHHINASYDEVERFVWNTYLIKDIDPNIKMKAASDCQKLEWIDIKDITYADNISEPMKKVINKIL